MILSYYFLKVVKKTELDIIIPKFTNEINKFVDSILNENNNNNSNNSKLETKSQIKQLNDELNNFSLISLLKEHKIFEKSGENILPKTARLNGFYLADSRKIISFSLINNKVYQSYLNAEAIYDKCKNKPPPPQSVSNNHNSSNCYQPNELMIYFVNLLKQFESCSEHIFKEIPGLTELPLDYQAGIMKRNVIDLYIIFNIKYYQNGEMNLYLDNGQQITRELLVKFRGSFKTKLLYDCYDCLYKLNITEREKAILVAFILTLPGIILLLPVLI